MKIVIPECHNCESRFFSVFSNCNQGEIESINKDKNAHFYRRGEELFSQGPLPTGLFCLHKGKIKIVKQNKEGKEQIVRLVKPGDLVGFRSFILNEPYSSSAYALDDSYVCMIPERNVRHMIEGTSDLKNELFKLLSRSLGKAEEKIAKMALKPVRERMSEALLLLYATYGKGEKNFSISISREDLSSLAGTAKETAIRFLSEFKAEKLIETKGSKITILNPEKLLEISSLYD